MMVTVKVKVIKTIAITKCIDLKSLGQYQTSRVVVSEFLLEVKLRGNIISSKLSTDLDRTFALKTVEIAEVFKPDSL